MNWRKSFVIGETTLLTAISARRFDFQFDTHTFPAINRKEKKRDCLMSIIIKRAQKYILLCFTVPDLNEAYLLCQPVHLWIFVNIRQTTYYCLDWKKNIFFRVTAAADSLFFSIYNKWLLLCLCYKYVCVCCIRYLCWDKTSFLWLIFFNCIFVNRKLSLHYINIMFNVFLCFFRMFQIIVVRCSFSFYQWKGCWCAQYFFHYKLKIYYQPGGRPNSNQ